MIIGLIIENLHVEVHAIYQLQIVLLLLGTVMIEQPSGINLKIHFNSKQSDIIP